MFPTLFNLLTVGIAGVIVTTFDGTAKGGILLVIIRELGQVIKLIGMREKAEQLQSLAAAANARDARHAGSGTCLA